MGTWLWSVVTFIHVLAAAFWVGGQLLLVAVVLPELRRAVGAQQLRQLAGAAGARFQKITNRGLLPALLLSGVVLAGHDGVRPGNLATTAFGRVLLVKAGLVVVVFSLAALHGWAAHRLPHHTRALAALTLAVSVAILGMGAGLSQLGGP
ncbi:MAG: hypothetical protein ACREN4_05700 [Candidatus Dormibacteria bacterium]